MKDFKNENTSFSFYNEDKMIAKLRNSTQMKKNGTSDLFFNKYRWIEGIFKLPN